MENKRIIINQEMEKLAKYLEENFDANTVSTVLKTESEDGRTISLKLESEITEIIKKYCELNNNVDYVETPIRGWADFKLNIKNKNIDVPVNIKCPSIEENKRSSSDNASSNNSFVWTFFGEGDDWSSANFWKKLDAFKDKLKKEDISKRIRECENDYYYLVINKESNNDVFYNSMKQLTVVKENSSNLPFQIQ